MANRSTQKAHEKIMGHAQFQDEQMQRNARNMRFRAVRLVEKELDSILEILGFDGKRESETFSPSEHAVNLARQLGKTSPAWSQAGQSAWHAAQRRAKELGLTFIVDYYWRDAKGARCNPAL